MISFECNNCGKKLQVKDEFAGHTGKCPACAATMDIPLLDEAQAPAGVYEVVPQEPEPAEPPREAGRPATTTRRRSTSYDEDGWEPPAETYNHGGGPLTPNDDFFAPPPPDIGDVISVYTSLRHGGQPMAAGTRMIVAVLVGSLGLAIGVAIALSLVEPFWQLFWPVLLGALGLGIALLATGFKHTCTYVGKEGLARFRCSGTRENVIGEVFCFRDATELRTAQTRHYTNGVYQNTTYSYTWSDVGGRPRFAISGSHRSEPGTPAAKDAFHFATSAERAWTLYLLEQVQAQLQTSGTIFFGLGGRNWVRLGEETISLHFNGETTECSAGDIDQVRIDQGMVQVRRKDAQEGWFSSRGVFKFPYGSLGNAQLFVILMDKLVGVRIN